MTGGRSPDPRSNLPRMQGTGAGPQGEAIAHLVRQELQGSADADFAAAVIPPRQVTVNFSGGATRRCWQVTQANGPYTVVYMPDAACFSLCVASAFGPVDIGVHGSAADCYGSV